jgi:hypothetical protein
MAARHALLAVLHGISEGVQETAPKQCLIRAPTGFAEMATNGGRINVDSIAGPLTVLLRPACDNFV